MYKKALCCENECENKNILMGLTKQTIQGIIKLLSRIGQ